MEPQKRRSRRFAGRIIFCAVGFVLAGYLVMERGAQLSYAAFAAAGPLVAFEAILTFVEWIFLGEAAEPRRRSDNGETRMPAEPNLTGKWRVIYGLIGAGMAAAGFLWLRGTLWGTLLPIAGGWMVLEALIGWTVMNAVLGLGGPKE